MRIKTLQSGIQPKTKAAEALMRAITNQEKFRIPSLEAICSCDPNQVADWQKGNHHQAVYWKAGSFPSSGTAKVTLGEDWSVECTWERHGPYLCILRAKIEFGEYGSQTAALNVLLAIPEDCLEEVSGYTNLSIQNQYKASQMIDTLAPR